MLTGVAALLTAKQAFHAVGYQSEEPLGADRVGRYQDPTGDAGEIDEVPLDRQALAQVAPLAARFRAKRLRK